MKKQKMDKMLKNKKPLKEGSTNAQWKISLRGFYL
jgi:hypothetical protein